MKMCPFCGNQVEDNKITCPYCKRQLYVKEKIEINIRTFKMFKVVFLCIAVVLVIFVPALIYMCYKYPLMRPKGNICKDRCGLFSYDYAAGERYCVCDNSDVYLMGTGSFKYNT